MNVKQPPTARNQTPQRLRDHRDNPNSCFRNSLGLILRGLRASVVKTGTLRQTKPIGVAEEASALMKDYGLSMICAKAMADAGGGPPMSALRQTNPIRAARGRDWGLGIADRGFEDGPDASAVWTECQTNPITPYVGGRIGRGTTCRRQGVAKEKQSQSAGFGRSRQTRNPKHEMRNKANLAGHLAGRAELGRSWNGVKYLLKKGLG